MRPGAGLRRSRGIRLHLDLLGPKGGFEVRRGRLGREALDDGDVQAPALDDVELIADVPPDRVLDILARSWEIVQPGGLISDECRGELTRVLLAIPGRQPDESQPVLRPYEYGVMVAVPARRGRLTALFAEHHGQLHLAQHVASQLLPALARLQHPEIDRHRPIRILPEFLRVEDLLGQLRQVAISIVDGLPAVVVRQLRAKDHALQIREQHRFGDDRGRLT